ncbi:MAG: filamentous hemagglutinin N-terminal domain-containing protein [Betaproteobacteria bacterium]
MNKTYRLIWSEHQQAWVVTHEHVRSRGKRSSGRVGGARFSALISGALLATGLNAAPPAPPVNALPTGGQVIAGQAAINQAGNQLNIQQATQKAILNWQSFNIGAQAAVNFQQPNASAVALNRVTGPDPSAIYGRLSANGQVFLVNPNGVLFAPGAQVDVAGLVASTMNIRNDDFLSGNYRFTRDGSTAGVTNQGSIAAQYVALLAPEVRNEGIITARMGTAALAAGDAVTLHIAGHNQISIQVDKAAINTLVENRHLIQVDGGTVIMSAQSARELLGRALNSGSIEANGITTDGGVVRLTASHNINHSGSISANAGTNGRGGEVIVIADLANPSSRTDVSGSISARGGSQSGNGGFIETSANRLRIADSAVIDTRAPFGVTGQWLLDPYDFTIAAANGDITGSALGTALASNNVTIQTLDASVSCTNATCGTGSSSGNGDIFVNDSVTWSSDKKLTLSAWRNVHINAPINVNGAGGGLALEFAQAGDMFSFLPGIYTVSAPVNLATGTTFTTKAATDGPVINYTVIRDATALAAISSGLAGNYVLGTDITAPVTSWTPIGNTATPFMGIFDGLGHKVTGLQHTNAGADVDVGLFGNVGAAGLIQNVGVTNVNIAGSQNVGALAGFNNGFIVNSYATGTVQGTGTGDVGRIGGLVGFSPGPIQSSYANVTVTATSGNQTNDPLMMENPLSTGRGGIGGLAGVVGAAVGDSYARGNVTGINAVGGLVGFSGASISSSYSTGAVSGTTNAHGLVGQVFDPMAFTPFIFNSFWDTTTSGQITGGGGAADLITGLATAQMQTKSTFDSSGAGWDTNVAWELRNGQYPLLKQMLQPVYVIADNKTASFTNTAFTAFTSTTGPTGTPGGATTGTVTFTPSTANPTNAGTYTVTPGGVSVAAAGAGDQHGYRVEFVNGTLTITPAVLTTTITGSLVGSVSKVYDGSSTITGLTNANFSLSGWQGSDGATVTKTTGTITDGPNASASTTRPVTVTLALSDYVATGSTNFSNYTLPTSVSGNIGQISPKTVTLSATKTYDGSTTLTGGQVTITTGVAGEALTYSGATANSKNVVDNATNFISAITLLDGTGGLASNYQKPVLNAANAPVTINKANLVLSGTRVYDATTTVAGSVLTATGVNGETFSVTGAGAVASKNVQVGGGGAVIAQPLAGLGNLALDSSGNGGLTDNYNPITITGSSVTITRKTLDVAVPPAPSSANTVPNPPNGTLFKAFNGDSVAPVGSLTLKTAVTPGTVAAGAPYTGDTVSLNTSGANGQFRNASNVATANSDATTVAISGLALDGADRVNYQLPPSPTVPGEIVVQIVDNNSTISGQAVASIGQITGGRGGVNISTSGNITTFLQTSNNLLLDWNGFGIPAGHTADFVQPSASAVAVNRVLSGDASSLLGTLKSNGIVFLINPAGITFGPTASINVGGLVASAMNITGLTATPGAWDWTAAQVVFDATRLVFEGTAGNISLGGTLNPQTGSFWGFYGDTVTVSNPLGKTGGTATASASESWKNPNTLTLSARGNVNLDAAVNVPGIGRLMLETGQGSTDGGSNDYVVNAAPTLAGTDLFATRQGRTGSLVEYNVISDLAELRTMSGNVALGNHIDASATQTSGQEFVARDTDTFAGLKHEIRDLKGNGIIGTANGAVRDTGAVNVNISRSGDNVGGLVGEAYGAIINSYASGAVSGVNYVGGLVGYAGNSISYSYASGTVTGSGSRVGGLAGRADVISNSHASGAVSGSGSFTFYVGGLVGYANGSINISYASGTVTGSGDYVGGLVGSTNSSTLISNSYASGAVSGSGNSVGGLVGRAFNAISNSYASGTVTGSGSFTRYVGGLVGEARGPISNSYASGAVSGAGSVGGLLGTGTASASISNSYATGTVTGSLNDVGGLVGYTLGAISNSYATGTVTGLAVYVGGLVGYTLGAISNSYATGTVTGSGAYVGGLAGQAYLISNSYASGTVTSSGIYVGGLAGYAALSISNSYIFSNLTAPFSASSYAGFDFTNVWGIDEGISAPFLRNLPRPANLKVNTSTVDNIITAVLSQLTSQTSGNSGFNEKLRSAVTQIVATTSSTETQSVRDKFASFLKGADLNLSDSETQALLDSFVNKFAVPIRGTSLTGMNIRISYQTPAQ